MKNHLVTQLFGFCTAVLLGCTPVLAQPVPSVYRTDSRPPDEVFANGFVASGTSPSLFDHILLGSCRAQARENRSAWVSTMGRRNIALVIAEGMLRTGAPMAIRGGRNGLWLYTIQPDATYLRSTDVLRQAIAAGNSERDGYLPHHANILENALYERNRFQQLEVVTQRIYPSNIASAVFVTLVSTVAVNPFEIIQEVDGSGVSNPRFSPPTTTMTSYVDNLQALVPPRRVLDYPGIRRERAQSCIMECDGASYPDDSGHDIDRPERKRRSPPLTAAHCAAGPSRSEIFISSED